MRECKEILTDGNGSCRWEIFGINFMNIGDCRWLMFVVLLTSTMLWSCCNLVCVHKEPGRHVMNDSIPDWRGNKLGHCWQSTCSLLRGTCDLGQVWMAGLAVLQELAYMML